MLSDYDKEWRERVKREHPTWTDEEVSEYMAHVTDLMFDWE